MVIAEDCHSKGRRIESRSFYLLIENCFSINSFHVANDLSTRQPHNAARRCKEEKVQGEGSVEGTPGETRKKDWQAFQERKNARKDCEKRNDMERKFGI